jgi:hypothetical protein
MTDEEFEVLVRSSGLSPTLEQLGFMRAGYALAQSRIEDLTEEAAANGHFNASDALEFAADCL